MNDLMQKQKAKYTKDCMIPACKSYKCEASVSVVGSNEKSCSHKSPIFGYDLNLSSMGSL